MLDLLLNNCHNLLPNSALSEGVALDRPVIGKMLR